MISIASPIWDFAANSWIAKRWAVGSPRVLVSALASSWRQLLWSLARSPYLGFALATIGSYTAFFWKHLDPRLGSRARAIDGAAAVYFLGRRSAIVLSERELVAGYRGAARAGLTAQPRERGAAEVFTEWAATNRDVGMEVGHAAAVEEMLTAAYGALDGDRTFTAVDAGCGNGWIVRRLRNGPRCRSAVGVDGSAGMIAKARALDPAGSYFIADLMVWQPPQPVDLVVSMEVLYYIDDPVALLRRIATLWLKPGWICRDWYRSLSGKHAQSRVARVRGDPHDHVARGAMVSGVRRGGFRAPAGVACRARPGLGRHTGDARSDARRLSVPRCAFVSGSVSAVCHGATPAGPRYPGDCVTRRYPLRVLWGLLASAAALAQASPPLIDLPHAYYYREMYLPQLTSGPSSVAWSPDSSEVVYSMAGSLWRQKVDATVAEQLTDGPGYDYQPDWSPDGRFIVYASSARGGGRPETPRARTQAERASCSHGDAVNVEPRWSPDGRRIVYVSTAYHRHFHVFVADVQRRAAHERAAPDRGKQESPAALLLQRL